MFVTAVSTSCVNPIIYGNYVKTYWTALKQSLVWCKCGRAMPRDESVGNTDTSNHIVIIARANGKLQMQNSLPVLASSPRRRQMLGSTSETLV